MGLSREQYRAAIKARQTLTVAQSPSALAKGMKSLSDAGWDGDYVVPNQLSSQSLTGPVILLNNWYGWAALDGLDPEISSSLRRLGYLEGIPTNRWLDRALQILGLGRSDVYITQACVFLPRDPMGGTISDDVYGLSVSNVLRLELGSRIPVALGSPAQRACKTNGIPFVGATHPSYQGGEKRSQEIAAAIKQVLP